MATRAEQRYLNRELVRSTVIFFVVLACLLLVLGFFIYRQVSTNLFQGIDEQLQLAQFSFEKDEPWEGADPAGVASDGASKGNDSFDVGLGGFSGDLFAAMERNVGENPQLIFVIRSLDGSIQSGIALYEVEPDYLDDIPFDKKDLDAPRLRICNGHNLRTVTSAVQNDDGVTVGYVQVIANVDSEMGILDTFTKTMAVGFAIALVLAAAASYLLSRRMIRPIARSWRKQSEFVQNASHELRTPLSVIKTTQELLLEHPNDRIIDHFEGIAATIDESDRLARLAGDLLALTALDAGDAELEKERLSLDELAEAMASTYGEYAEFKGRKIDVSAESGAVVSGDCAKLRQLLAIVLDNAIKYTEEGDSIKVETALEGHRAHIRVSDTGIGVSFEDVERAFDRFYRADKAREAGGGRGLGLAIAKAIVDAHGGAIGMVPNPAGEGTLVEIVLPTE